MSSTSTAPVEHLDVATYTVPTDAPEGDGTLAWQATTLVLVTARAGGTTGLGWTYGPAAVAPLVAERLSPVVCGRDALDVPGSWSAMVQQVRNDTRAGVAGYAVSAVDCALWDLKARLLGVSLTRLLGRVRAELPVYGSGGFTTYDDARTRAQLAHWVEEQRIPRVKIKIGESWGRRVDRDLARVRLARDVIGADVELFVDANGAYQRGQAVRVGRACDELGVTWLEEPVSSDDLDGLRRVRSAVRADVAAGEYLADGYGARRLCEVVDCLQVDVTRCGGMTEWLRTAAVAASYGLDVSAHCAPHLHAPVAAAVPNLRHLEWFHDHVRVESLLFDGTLDPQGGVVRPDGAAPGLGLTVREPDAERFRVG